MANHLIGIDLGTTNTVVAHIDTTLDEDQRKPEIVSVPQVTAPGETQRMEALPSFLFIPDDNDVPDGALALPWDPDVSRCVGEMARTQASALPGKVVASNKSWLCVDTIDRLAPILPWNRGQSDKQVSPVDVSKLLLEHVKNAWNHERTESDERFEAQTVILTVPASFDAVARELTMTAAREAGLDVILLEEPLAAFYAWLRDVGDAWRETLSPGDVVLVCDVGGGTTDFTLIKAIDSDGNLEFERIAVGRHILLGGDNMDLTMAHVVANKLKTERNTTLDSHQIAGLMHACRQAKETLLSDEDAPPQPLTVLGRGSGIVGGTITTELSRDEAVSVILDGFLPVVSMDERPTVDRRAGLRAFGLNYETDPAISKHLAAFLANHCEPDAFPNCVLFNGGVTKSPAVRDRVLENLRGWLPEGRGDVRVLTGSNPDLSVAKGAAIYAEARDGKGIRVKAGSSHSYYVGVESAVPAVPGFTPPIQALCVVPFGAEEGTGADIPHAGLGLWVGETTEFRFFASNIRKDDAVGELIDDAEGRDDVQELPPLSATLPVEDDIPAGSLVPISLRGDLTETGTLQLWCVGDNDRKWKLEFELRGEG